MEQNTQLAIITQQTAEITKNVASIKTDITNAATENNRSLQACLQAGDLLLSRSSDGMTDELDAEMASFIKKAKATAKAMKERRSCVTQVFDIVKKGFTTMENVLDAKSEESVIFKLQKKRDEYAAYKLEQQRRAEEERQRQARIAAAKVQLHEDVISICNQIVNEQTAAALDRLSEKFRLLTIDNAEAVRKELQDFPTTIRLAAFIAERKPSVPVEVYPDEAKQIMNEAFKSVNDSLSASFTDSVAAARQDILDQFDSKLSELQEQRRLDEERKEAERKAKEAKDEAERKAAEVAAKKAEEERRQREAELKAAEAAAEKERQERLAAEQKQREDEERLRKAQAQTQSLFDQTPTVAAPVKAKVSHHIEIDAPEGFLAIIQMWWAKEGSNMTLEELTKKLSFMVKTCERVKNKEDVTIVDPHVHYVEDVVAK